MVTVIVVISPMDTLQRLQDLHRDLLAFSESRLANVDRLWLELETSVQEFRQLLDKKSKLNASRTTVRSGPC